MLLFKRLTFITKPTTLKSIHYLRPIYNFSQSENHNPVNHYQTLNISHDASLDQIKKKFRQLSKVYHPDYYKGTGNKFHDIQKAYKILSDSKTRKHHDINLGIAKAAWENQEFKLDSDKFENEAFDQVLSSQEKKHQQAKTIEQKLQEKFEKQIKTQMTLKQKMRALFFPCLGFGIFWALWNTFEIIIINYKGSQSHDVKTYIGQKKLSAIPIKLN